MYPLGKKGDKQPIQNDVREDMNLRMNDAIHDFAMANNLVRKCFITNREMKVNPTIEVTMEVFMGRWVLISQSYKLTSNVH